ncbi:hypothetical protein VTN77DRAFT_939 [Rasamsonia byssochlamydoides]|uniref:uncharacterized protein n=1 Tax=Rasamsonia byssochlamydoides TaxID=89139 RepID=UPI003743F377
MTVPNYLIQGADRGDLLTVREVARLQGFPDDFVFYGSKDRQYQQVLEGFPPPIAKAIAGSIMATIDEFRVAPTSDEMDVESDPQRGTKRQRTG